MLATMRAGYLAGPFIVIVWALGMSSEMTAQVADRGTRLPTPVSIAGQPVLGSYSVETPEDVMAMRGIGMNLVLGGHDHLDASTPLGKACSDSGVYVLYHLTQHVYGMPRLRDRIGPDAVQIPFRTKGARAHPPAGVILLDDELIRYEASDANNLFRCTRGYAGTRRASHRGGMFVFWPDECEREILSVRDAAMLWGYYVLDDSPGDAISALRGIYRIVKRVDPKRIVAAGYGSAGSLCNFGPGVCDLMLIYWYPVSGSGKYDPLMTSHQVQWMIASAREQVPGMPFAGVYQTFDAAFDRPGNEGKGLPTAQQIRTQIEDFVREGACGLVAYLGGAPGLPGWNTRPYMRTVLTEVHRHIRETGALPVPPEPEAMRAARVFPIGGATRPRPIAGIPPAWHVILPFVGGGHDPLGPVYAPEREIRLDAVYDGKVGPVRWEVRRTCGGVIGLGELVTGPEMSQGATAYATCVVVSPRDQAALIRFGSDDDMVIWLNGDEVVRRVYVGGLSRDAETRQVPLRQGTNRLLVKVHNRAGMWGFHLRLTDTLGKPLSGVRFSPRPQEPRTSLADQPDLA